MSALHVLGDCITLDEFVASFHKSRPGIELTVNPEGDIYRALVKPGYVYTVVIKDGCVVYQGHIPK